MPQEIGYRYQRVSRTDSVTLFDPYAEVATKECQEQTLAESHAQWNAGRTESAASSSELLRRDCVESHFQGYSYIPGIPTGTRPR
jgi:hypothetical protein